MYRERLITALHRRLRYGYGCAFINAALAKLVDRWICEEVMRKVFGDGSTENSK